MSFLINNIKINSFRNIKEISLAFSKDFNVIYGNNGSGKTSLLEALCLLSLGKSFRSSQLAQLIQRGQNSFALFGDIGEKGTIGILKEEKKPIQVKKDGQKAVSFVKLAKSLPLQLIHADSFQLFDGGPKMRRKFIDWGVFHVEQGFFPVWKRFQTIIQQRNAALKNHSPIDMIRTWDNELIHCSQTIDDMRNKYINEFKPLFTSVVGKLLPFSFDVGYERGWPGDRDYKEILNQNLAKDRIFGYTYYGPHRANLSVSYKEKKAQEFLSRGQMKLLICALKLAQGQHLKLESDIDSMYLVDDLASELDDENRAKFLKILSEMKSQVFITSIYRDSLDFSAFSKNVTMFHVEQGEFNPD